MYFLDKFDFLTDGYLGSSVAHFDPRPGDRRFQSKQIRKKTGTFTIGI